MRYWTWTEIKTKVEQDLDLEDEDFVRESELLSLANEAIDEAEAEIHTLYEDYFLSKATISVVANDTSFSIPTYLSDIYGDKIRRILFQVGVSSTVYTVNRLRDWHKFEEKALADAGTNNGDLYRYMLLNQTAGSPQILLVPAAREAGTLTVWYLRNANRLTTGSDVCDIPEFINFVIAHIKCRILHKEGNPNYSEALERLEAERTRMNATLSSRVPDANNEIEMDMSVYEDMS
jgi:hypothetical protein